MLPATAVNGFQLKCSKNPLCTICKTNFCKAITQCDHIVTIKPKFPQPHISSTSCFSSCKATTQQLATLVLLRHFPVAPLINECNNTLVVQRLRPANRPRSIYFSSAGVGAGRRGGGGAYSSCMHAEREPFQTADTSTSGSEAVITKLARPRQRGQSSRAMREQVPNAQTYATLQGGSAPLSWRGHQLRSDPWLSYGSRPPLLQFRRLPSLSQLEWDSNLSCYLAPAPPSRPPPTETALHWTLLGIWRGQGLHSVRSRTICNRRQDTAGCIWTQTPVYSPVNETITPNTARWDTEQRWTRKERKTNHSGGADG